jgi:hypothetical protein
MEVIMSIVLIGGHESSQTALESMLEIIENSALMI